MQCGWMPGPYNISYTYLERIQSMSSNNQTIQGLL